MFRIRQQDANLVHEHLLNEREIGGVERQWEFRKLARLVRERGFPRQEQPLVRFDEQDLGGLVWASKFAAQLASGATAAFGGVKQLMVESFTNTLEAQMSGQ